MNYTSSTLPTTSSSVDDRPENVTVAFQNATAPPDTQWDSTYDLLIILNTVFFSFIIASGVIGNAFVVSTLARWRDMRTPCNFLIGNISVADLCVCLISAPLRIIEPFYDWPFGRILCFLVFPFQDVFVCVSVVTHTIIALERHRAIVAPFKPKLSRAQVKLAIALTWIGSYAACAVPEIVYLKYEKFTAYSSCIPVFPTKAVYRISYEMYLVVFSILTPLVIQGTAYIRIINVLQRKDEIQVRCRSFDANDLQRQNFRLRAAQKKRLVKMLVTCMVLFQICYLPRGVIMLTEEFAPLVADSLPFWYADVSLLALFYIKHIVNPVILWAMSKDFQGAFKAICICNEGYAFERESGNNKTKSRTLSKTKRYPRVNDAR